MKLDDKFVNIRTNILMMQPLPSVSLAYRLLIQEEKQRTVAQLQGESSNTMAFVADYKREGYRKREYKPYRPPLQSNNYSSQGNYRNNDGHKKINYYCDHCKVPGHSRQRCFALNGFPPNFQPKTHDKGKKVAAIITQDCDEQEDPEA